MVHNYSRFVRSFPPSVACATALLVLSGLPLRADSEAPSSRALSTSTPGLSVQQLAKVPNVIFARELPDVPGRNLIVVALTYPAHPTQPSTHDSGAPQRCRGHRHPGSTYVYVTSGEMRLGIAGQPVQTLHAGESFFEPPGVLHNVAESASATEPASVIAVQILPAGTAILTPEKCTSP
jgi:mannose-6-phosphate isomerase-like protein (cupin superfamily)